MQESIYWPQGKYFTKVFSKKYFENTILFCILKILCKVFYFFIFKILFALFYFLFWKYFWEVFCPSLAQRRSLAQGSALPASCFPISTFWGHFSPNPTIMPPAWKSQPAKSRITYKPFKIYQKCLLNMHKKSGSHFQSPQSEITWSAYTSD